MMHVEAPDADAKRSCSGVDASVHGTAPGTPAADELDEHARRGPTRSLTAVIAVVRPRAASASVDRPER